MKKILIALVLLSSFFAANAQRVTSYARSGQNVKLDLNWTGQNYGQIQWQRSTDNGQTWTDIAGATESACTVKVSASTLLRARVDGDPSCPPLYLEREVKPVSFNTSVDIQDWDHVVMSVTDANFADADIVEYGYAAALSALSRNYELMPLTPVGTRLPAGDFEMRCDALKPNTAYNLRFYVKTADGSVIYGPGKFATTLPGLAWNSEDWYISRNSITAQFLLSGSASARNIKCYYGQSEDNLSEVAVTSLANGKYKTTAITRLHPATDYIIKVTAEVDGDEQTIIKTVRTLTDYSPYQVDETVQPVKHRINWGRRTLTRLTPTTITAVEYPRICRLSDQELLLTYHGSNTNADQWQNCYYQLSHDNGLTWDAPVMIFDKTKSFYGSGFWRICNPQATRLANGWVILSAVANANPETNENCKVICTISKDNCRTWSDPIIVGRGRTWEPHVVQLPGGELELYVSSEAAWYGTGNWVDQEIVFARSTDNGLTWTAFQRASYLSGGRDGMPVPIVMQGNKGVLFTIESPAAGTSPSFVHRRLDAEWETTAWNRVDSDRRWATGLNNGGGAPYCVQMPSGEIVVLCHTNPAGAVWQTCRPQVGMCDNTGHNIRNKTIPASTSNPLKSNEGAYYNSLFVKDDETIWLLVTRATYNGSTRTASSIEVMEGKLVEQ